MAQVSARDPRSTPFCGKYEDGSGEQCGQSVQSMDFEHDAKRPK